MNDFGVFALPEEDNGKQILKMRPQKLHRLGVGFKVVLKAPHPPKIHFYYSPDFMPATGLARPRVLGGKCKQERGK